MSNKNKAFHIDRYLFNAKLYTLWIIFVQTKLIGFFLSQDLFQILNFSLVRYFNRAALGAVHFAILQLNPTPSQILSLILNVSLSSVDSKATCWSLPISFKLVF